MSEILIKGMEMPKTEKDSFLVIIKPNEVIYHHDEDELKRYEAVELPPHGDLIDRRKLWKDTEGLGEFCSDRDFINLCDAISEAPTILEASK